MSDNRPQTGDRVRVVLEGDVKLTDREGFFVVGGADGKINNIHPGDDHVLEVEVVSKLVAKAAATRLGDLVVPGQRVRNEYDHAHLFMRTHDGWVDTRGMHYTLDTGPVNPGLWEVEVLD